MIADMLSNKKLNITVTEIFAGRKLKIFLPTDTRRLGNFPWRSPKGPKVWDLQGTFRELLRDQQKNWSFNEKSVF